MMHLATCISAFTLTLTFAAAGAPRSSGSPRGSLRPPARPNAFTQRLLFFGDVIFESVGRHGQSSLRKVPPRTGEVLQQVKVPDEFFVEGLAQVGDQLIELTWREGVALAYDLGTFRRVGSAAFTIRAKAGGSATTTCPMAAPHSAYATRKHLR